MTSPGTHADRLRALPDDAAALVRVVQGLLLHRDWAASYSVALSEERLREAHIRPVRAMLGRFLGAGAPPLSVARVPRVRLVGVCRHFSVLLTGLLRARGIPARARCGFAAYFTPGRFLDHWVCECRPAGAGRWILVDAQLDAVQRDALRPDFDPLDVTRDRFLVAGDAWAACRSGAADPEALGIFHMQGLWFIAGNLVRDLAALNGMEMLPWDVWGVMPRPGEPVGEAQLGLFDRLAALTQAPDRYATGLEALYRDEPGLEVPAAVYNAVLGREESL